MVLISAHQQHTLSRPRFRQSHYVSAVNETVIRVAADKLIDLGLAEAGYTYLNIDGEATQQ